MNILETDQNGHLILEIMRIFDLGIGDSIDIDILADQSFARGFGLDEFENALIHASANGWIFAANTQVHLTGAGHKLLNAANDNSRRATPSA